MPNKKRSNKKKILLGTGFISVLFIISFIIYFNYAVKIDPPRVENSNLSIPEIIKSGDTLSICGNNWLRKNKYGLWEMGIEGRPYERGLIMGKLSGKLIQLQEAAFVKQLEELVPSKFELNILRYFIAWFDRNIDLYIDDEYKKEIYGLSFAASNDYNYIASKYQRILNYHAAHDIGHALQGMYMIGCTSFSVWDSLSENGDLLVGRNFDFYVSDDFAKEKIVLFMKPSDGYKFMMVTWGGMIGAVSGMNDHGLSVTINAAKSDLPFSAATPISIVARRILQYAKDIKDALKIAQSYKTFVSETIMIGSKEDNRTYLIEKTPNKTELFTPNSNYTICTNHYQTTILGAEAENQKNIKESSTQYRFNRVKELLMEGGKINITKTAAILRNQLGKNNDSIGFGNEKSINQLIAHHSVIFDTKKLIAYVSTEPFQLGPYIAYDLNKIFTFKSPPKGEIIEDSLTITADPFLYSQEFVKFNRFRQLRKILIKSIKTKETSGISESSISELISCNPKYYEVYSIAGDFFFLKNDKIKSKAYYSLALSREIPIVSEVKRITNRIMDCQK
jgi:isopenicillin-N N-acyltransferase like protein